MAGALLRYRVLAYIVGTALLVLTVIGVPLQYAGGHPVVVEVVGPIHGFLYIVYLIAGADLARRARFSLLQIVAIIAAGLVPFLTFVVERKTTARVERQLAEENAVS